jgi:hypothetical protein
MQEFCGNQFNFIVKTQETEKKNPHVSKGHKPQEAHHRPEHRSCKLGVAISNLQGYWVHFTRCSRKGRHLEQVTSNTVQSARTRPYRNIGIKGAGRHMLQ